MAIPNCQHIVADLAARFPDEWRKAHNPSGGGPETEAFIRRLAWVIHSTIDPRCGLNGKRGNPNDLSDDALNFKGEGPGHDPTDGNRPVTVVDCIGGAGGPNPTPVWQVFDTLPGPGAWVKPEPVGEVVPPPVSDDVWTSRHAALLARMGTSGTLAVAQQFAHSFPDESWGQKRAGAGRSISTDTIARRLPNGRLYGVRISPSVQLWGVLDAAQVFEPVVPVNHLGDGPVEPPPVDPPPVDPPVDPPPVDPGLAMVLQALMAVANDAKVAAEQARDYAKRAATQHYEGEGRTPFGKVTGTIKPKPVE